MTLEEQKQRWDALSPEEKQKLQEIYDEGKRFGAWLALLLCAGSGRGA
jgi:hypothetical protein